MVVQPLSTVTTPEPCPGPTESESQDDKNQQDLFEANFVFVLFCFYILRHQCVRIFFLLKVHLWLYSEWTSERWVSGLPRSLIFPSQSSREPGSLGQEDRLLSARDLALNPSSTHYSVTLGTGKEPKNTTYIMVVRFKWDNAGKSSVAASNTFRVTTHSKSLLFCNIQLTEGKNKVTKLKKEVDCFSWNFGLLKKWPLLKTCYTDSLSKKLRFCNLSNHVPTSVHSPIRQVWNFSFSTKPMHTVARGTLDN